MERIEIEAPAKINVGLNIVKKRQDGFHDLETIFYQVYDLFDKLTIEKSNKLDLVLNAENHDLASNNIIIKAVKLLEEKVQRKLNVKIELEKNIPIGAGLGGGSSDGASTLIAMNNLFDLNLTLDELKVLALKLGSDVPLFLYNYPTIGKSRGEELEKLEFEIDKPILLVNPGIHISTKNAFSHIIPKPNIFNYSNIGNYKISEWSRKIINDFEGSIFKIYPEISEIKNKLYNHGALFSLMSGTGSTVYGIFNSLSDAESASKNFPQNYFIFIGNKL